MNVATMRRVDALLGVPLCAALTLARRVTAPFRRPTERPVERIAFFKLAEQGSTVLAYPALERAVDLVGAENVWFVVFEQNRAILDAMQIVPRENVVAIPTESVLGTLVETLRALRRLRRLRIDAAIDLEFFARSTAALAWLSGAPRRVGMHAYTGDGPWRGDLMTHRVLYNPHLHTAQLFRLQVDVLGQPPERLPAVDLVPQPVEELPRGRLRPRPEELEEVRAIVRDVTGAPGSVRLLLLNANCSDLLPLRRWADDNYVDLARRLLRTEPDLWIGFTGAPAESLPVEALVRRIDSPRCVSFAGKTTMRQLLVLYECAEALVTNDSGPAHFASLTSTDIVTLFGPETPKLFGVVSPRSHVLWAELPCSPCVNAYNNRLSRCRDNVCLQRITVDEVERTVRTVFARRAAARREQAVPGA